MNYRLIVLTHGGGRTLEPCLESFTRHVTPPPVDAFVHIDAGDDVRAHDAMRVLGVPFTSESPFLARGFCGSCKAAWREGALGGDHDYVLWLEHDFVFVRDVDLVEVGTVLWQQDGLLAQMALMRDAVNETEKAAGGLFESRRDEYTLRRHGHVDPRLVNSLGQKQITYKPWLEHSSYFTTNVNLMTREFMIKNPWPSYESECEGRFGIDLRERGYTFGVWGDGSVYCEHIGDRVRDGGDGY